MRVTKKLIKGKPVWNITWPTRPISRKSYDILTARIRKSQDYGPIYHERLASFAATLVPLRIDVEAGLSIRAAVTKSKVITGTSRVDSRITEIAAEYESGTSIMNLSVKYDFPPLGLLQKILYEMGYDRGQLRDIFANRADPRDLLDGRNLEEYKNAFRNDAESAFNQQMIAEQAADNEEAFVEWIRSMGIGLRTQDDLVKEQVAEFGRAVLTPDVLFTDEVFINGSRIHWIDYKDYVGTPVFFLLDSNRKQAAKYRDKWGPGAMCYRLSFVKDLKIPGAILLDLTAGETPNLRSL